MHRLIYGILTELVRYK